MAHPATIPERDLLRECVIAGGAITHVPTGVGYPLHTHATEIQRQRALSRVRLQLAAKIRTPFDGGGLADAWWRNHDDPSRLRSDLPRHRDFPAFAALALDAMAHRDWRLKGAAGALGVRPWSLHRAVSGCVLLGDINEKREEMGLRPLRGRQ